MISNQVLVKYFFYSKRCDFNIECCTFLAVTDMKENEITDHKCNLWPCCVEMEKAKSAMLDVTRLKSQTVDKWNILSEIYDIDKVLTA